MQATEARLIILVDNISGESGLASEHGFALWVEAGGLRILFDTGQGKALVRNAERLQVPLDATDYVVLSHGHYDHTGGLVAILDRAPQAKLILHPQALTSRYSLSPGQAPRSIGMPPASQALVNQLPKEQIIWSSEPLTLIRGIGVTGPIPRQTPFEDGGGPFTLDPQGKVKDDILDDQALWISSPEGLVICLGCGHSGLVNTINQVRRLTGETTIAAVIGGFHLVQADQSRIDATIQALQGLSPQTMIPCHCTGEKVIQALKSAFGHRVAPGATGLLMRLPFTP